MSTQIPDDENEKTVVGRPEPITNESDKTQVLTKPTQSESSVPVSYEQTQVFTKEEKNERVKYELGEIEAPKATEKEKAVEVAKTKGKIPTQARTIILGILALIMISEWFEDDKNTLEKVEVTLPAVYKVSLPSYSTGPSDIIESKKNYQLGMRLYLQDNASAYKKAAKAFLKSTSLDVKNTQSPAMLASTYLNLIDASAKDEGYFSIVNKLIEMAKAKSVSTETGTESSELLIAEVELYIAMNRPDASQAKIVEYTRKIPTFGSEIYYYSALTSFAKGEYSAAAKYLNQFGESTVMGPRVFYLAGRIAEKLGQPLEAVKEYQKAIKLDQNHVKSILKIAQILSAGGKLASAKPLLDQVLKKSELLFPTDLGQAAYLRARAYELSKDWNSAYKDIQISIAVEPSNPDYLFEYYTIKVQATNSSDNLEDAKAKAKMYGFLGAGEKLYAVQKYSQALDEFMKARNAYFKATAPLVRIGDVFQKLGDFRNAAINFKKAIDLSPNDTSIEAKYVEALIDGYEWEAATSALERLQKMKGSAFLYYNLMGMFLAKQGQVTGALSYYKQAMGIGGANPAAYIGYADLLRQSNNCGDAPFFYSMALRVDPLNRSAMIGMAKCYVLLDSIDKGISFLQEEIQKLGSDNAGLLSAIAEMQLKKGDLDQALQNVDQAEVVDPTSVEILKIKAKIFLAKSAKEKKAIQKALDYFALYSEKNPGDPTGYMERYKIYLKRRQFEYAGQELDKVLFVSPKFPGLREAKAEIFLAQGNKQQAIDELESEVKNNPGSPHARLALAKLMIDAGELQRATLQLEEAMKLDQQSAEIKYHMGLVHLMRRNFVPAIALFRGAIQSDPGNPDIYRELTRAYLAISDRDNAQKTLQLYEERAPDAKDLQELQKQLQ